MKNVTIYRADDGQWPQRLGVISLSPDGKGLSHEGDVEDLVPSPEAIKFLGGPRQALEQLAGELSLSTYLHAVPDDASPEAGDGNQPEAEEADASEPTEAAR